MWGSPSPSENELGDVQQPTSNSTELLKSLDVLNDIDTKFNDLYDNIVVNLNNYNLHSSAVQKIEVKELTDALNAKRASIKSEESGLD